MNIFASHLVLGVTLIGFAVWLHLTEKKGWPNESMDGELDADYLQRRMRSRRRVNVILGICGVLILAAGIGPPVVFVAAWMSVFVALFIVMLLAALDVIRTQRYMNNKMPEIRRRMTDGDN